MKVAVFEHANKIEIKQKNKPKTQPTDVLVKIEYCGICGSDVHAYLYGGLIPDGTIMGHECSGTVSEVGEEVQNVKLGDRVVIKPIAPCGKCYWCQRGRYSLCPTVHERAIGIYAENDGAFAEYLLIKHPNEMLIKLPDSVSFQDAALGDPLACGLHGVHSSQFSSGDNAVIIGAGTIGLGVLQFLRLKGAGKIAVIEISSEKSRIAKEMGADIVLDPISEAEFATQKIYELTDGIGADVIFECAGVPLAFQASMDYVKKGGQIILIGINDREIPFIPFKMIISELEMKGVLGFYDEFRTVIDLIEQKKINTDRLISDVISLDDIEKQGFERLSTSPDLVKVLVRP